MKKREYLFISLKGAAMGMAEVIPGVSGGTIAFITGIYERLVNSIKSFGPEIYNSYKEEGLRGAYRTADGSFLLALLTGMLVGIIFGVLVITSLLENYPEILWGFFFGLIVASALYLLKLIRKWDWKTLLSLAFGIVIALMIVFQLPVRGSDYMPYVFLSGFIAVSALMLPGISGSFILVLMGMYVVILPAVREVITFDDMSVLPLVLIFALGMITGLATISRILSWAFKKFPRIILALLSGFIIGSLPKIWPWRIPIRWVDPEGNFISAARDLPAEMEVKVVQHKLVLPVDYPEPYLLWVIGAVILGLVTVLILDYLTDDPRESSGYLN